MQAARELAADTLTRCRRVFGDDHAATLYLRVTLAGALAVLGEVQAARELAADTLAPCRRAFGDDHPITRATEEVLRWLD
jgi:hypothetical protein